MKYCYSHRNVADVTEPILKDMSMGLTIELGHTEISLEPLDVGVEPVEPAGANGWRLLQVGGVRAVESGRAVVTVGATPRGLGPGEDGGLAVAVDEPEGKKSAYMYTGVHKYTL